MDVRSPLLIDEVGQMALPPMAKTWRKSEKLNVVPTRRQLLLNNLGFGSINAVPLQTRLIAGLGYIPGDKFYLGLPYKRVKGKWKVKK